MDIYNAVALTPAWSDADLRALDRACVEELGCKAEDLLAVLVSESKLDPAARSPKDPSKWPIAVGLNQLTRHLAVRYGRDGIRANAIAPGFILTETARTQVPADIQTRLADANPTRRLGTPADIANVVVFLCSDAAAYVNGQVLHVDGGHQIAGMM